MTKSDYEKVKEAIEDRFYEEGLLSAVREIVGWTDLSESRVRDIVEEMTGSGLYKIYKGAGKPTIFITEDMKNSLTAQAGEPDWIDSYQFQEKVEISNEIREKQEKVSDYQEIEGLIYSTGEQLEKSVEKSLEILGFTPESTKEDEDFVIKYRDNIYIVEVKGKGGPVSKGDVAQLGTWLDKWAEKENPEKLKGLLLANPHRHEPPSDRDDPLTESAENFLGLRPAFYRTTEELFNLVKQVKKGEKDREDAREDFLEFTEDG